MLTVGGLSTCGFAGASTGFVFVRVCFSGGHWMFSWALFEGESLGLQVVFYFVSFQASFTTRTVTHGAWCTRGTCRRRRDPPRSMCSSRTMMVVTSFYNVLPWFLDVF